MLKKYFIRFIQSLLILNLLVVVSSCQKVIELDLKSSTPQFVIEGEISDKPGLNYVRITKSVNYNEDNTFPPVTGAVVTISDNAGNVSTLTETSAGLYQLNTLQGVPGTNYILNVQAQGKEFQALSSMPGFVSIQDATVDSITFGAATAKYINLTINDPAGVKNFYRVIEIINGDTLGIINVTNDQFQDGKTIIFPVFSDEDPELKSGDEVELILQNIDETTFDYFVQLIDVINSGSSSTAPGNPTNNLNNGALGYFSAYSSHSKTIIIP